MNTTKISPMIDGICMERVARYNGYFDTLRPKTPEEKFRRGLFALASVHTTWKSNVNLYAYLHDLKWVGHPRRLKARIADSRAGLVNNRTKFLTQFASTFWKDPSFYERKQGESWVDCRNRIEKATPGLGHAKSSFFLELLYFQDAEVVCGDTHQLQWYGLKSGTKQVNRKIMDDIENHWIQECKMAGVPPVTARWVVWDQKMGKPDPTYWSWCLESDNPKSRIPEQGELFDEEERLSWQK